ncbi:MAG: transcriptional adapter 2 [Lasallia pustulata]|uniref:Transcriptional adapter 2 n=1 Tax=Lasallia pustulata TaxID=136370 RepID=A0A1W5DCR3_9LECA|nr:MAG: transcriptional adapter 2 [Lasallia pustulata]SLM40841.1 saga complex subunit [Lasallia pustulata]
MGVIKKKTVTRGTEGGVKYICDVCSADITNTVRIRCANSACNDYDLCVPCFANGSSTRDHDPRTHSYSVIEQHSIPIYTKDWGADEELLLLEGAELYGLGSWSDIADHIGGYRTKEEVRDHYIDTYIQSSKFPLPERADPKDDSLREEMPREKFQARKKRRIEERKEAAKTAPPATPKQKPTASVPACHEVQGYMPGRLEFETEFANEAEEAVQHMQFDPGDGINPRTGEVEPEMELKLVVMDIYNSRLTARGDRKKVIFEHNLLDYRKNAALDKKRTKEERDLLNKAKPFARMMNHADFDAFTSGLEYEHNLRQAIAQLQDWRQMRIGDLRSGEKYEQEKQQRAARPAPTGSFDRFASARSTAKPTPPIETPSATTALTAPELPERLKPPVVNAPKGPLTNGTANGALTPSKANYVVPPLASNGSPRLTNENATDLHLLTKEEVELCNVLRIMPKPYLVIKESLLKEAMKTGGMLKRKAAREVAKIDATKSGRIFEFLADSGWIQKA